MSLFHVDHDDGDDELDHESIPNGAEYQRKNSGKREKRKKKNKRAGNTTPQQRGEPGQPRAKSPQKHQENKIFIKFG